MEKQNEANKEWQKPTLKKLELSLDTGGVQGSNTDGEDGELFAVSEEL